jgi:hypothetical protein
MSSSTMPPKQTVVPPPTQGVTTCSRANAASRTGAQEGASTDQRQRPHTNDNVEGAAGGVLREVRAPTRLVSYSLQSRTNERVFYDQELSSIILSSVTDLTDQDMKTFKKWLTHKTPSQDLQAYLKLDVKWLTKKDHARIRMIQAKVFFSQTPDEFTALRDFGPYIIWVMRDSATRLERARQQGYTDQRAIDSIATCIADFYMTVQLLDPVVQSRCDALGVRRRQTWMDALPADYHRELQNIHMPMPRLRTKTAERTDTPSPQLEPTPPRRNTQRRQDPPAVNPPATTTGPATRMRPKPRGRPPAQQSLIAPEQQVRADQLAPNNVQAGPGADAPLGPPTDNLLGDDIGAGQQGEDLNRTLPPPLEPDIIIAEPEPPPQEPPPQKPPPQPPPVQHPPPPQVNIEQRDHNAWTDFPNRYEDALRAATDPGDNQEDADNHRNSEISDPTYNGDDKGYFVLDPDVKPPLRPDQTEYHTPDDSPNVIINDEGDISIKIPAGTELTQEQVDLITRMHTPWRHPPPPNASTGARTRPVILSNVQDLINERARQSAPNVGSRMAQQGHSDDIVGRTRGEQAFNPSAYLPRTQSQQVRVDTTTTAPREITHSAPPPPATVSAPPVTTWTTAYYRKRATTSFPRVTQPGTMTTFSRTQPISSTAAPPSAQVAPPVDTGERSATLPTAGAANLGGPSITQPTRQTGDEIHRADTQDEEEFGNYRKSLPDQTVHHERLCPETHCQMYSDSLSRRGEQDRKNKRDDHSRRRRHRDSSSEDEVDWTEYVMNPDLDMAYQVADHAYYHQFMPPWNITPPSSTRAQDKRDAKLLEDSKLLAGMKFKGTIESYFIWRKMFIVYIHGKNITLREKGLQLLATIDTKVREYNALRHLLMTPKGNSYFRAIQLLEQNYGGADRLRQFYLDAIEAFPPLRHNDIDQLQELLELILEMTLAFESHDILDKLASCFFADKLRAKMPEQYST